MEKLDYDDLIKSYKVDLYLKDKKTKDIDKATSIAVTYQNIQINYENKVYRFNDIVIAYINSENIIVLKGRHPHIRKSDICLGKYEPRIKKYFRHSYYLAFSSIHSILNNYDPYNSHNPIRDYKFNCIICLSESRTRLCTACKNIYGPVKSINDIINKETKNERNRRTKKNI